MTPPNDQAPAPQAETPAPITNADVPPGFPPVPGTPESDAQIASGERTPAPAAAQTATPSPLPVVDAAASSTSAQASPEQIAPQDPLTSTAAGAEPFTNADGTPGAIVTEATGADLSKPSTPVLIASIAIYREPDGRLSLVKEHEPQTWHEVGSELMDAVKAYLHPRVGTYRK